MKIQQRAASTLLTRVDVSGMETGQFSYPAAVAAASASCVTADVVDLTMKNPRPTLSGHAFVWSRGSEVAGGIKLRKRKRHCPCDNANTQYKRRQSTVWRNVGGITAGTDKRTANGKRVQKLNAKHATIERRKTTSIAKQWNWRLLG